jgi:DNA-directed RNA polymerase beta subunit
MDSEEQKLPTAVERFLRRAAIVRQDPRSLLVHQFARYSDVAAPQIDSENQFLEKAKAEVINTTEIRLENGHMIAFSDAEIANPSMLSVDQSKQPMYPNFCRVNDRTYKGAVNATATWYDEQGEVRGKSTIYLHDLAIMLRSSACNLTQLTNEQLEQVREDKDDPFGYFIVDGAEKAIVMQERVAPNVLLSYQDPKDKVTANNPLASTINTEIKCVAPDGRKVKVSVRVMKKADDDMGESKRSNASFPVLKLTLPSFVESGAEINVCAIFGVLGLLNPVDPNYFKNTDNIQAWVLDWVPDEDKQAVAKYLDYTLEAYSMYIDNPLGYIAKKLRLTERDLSREQMQVEVIRQVRDSLFVNMREYLTPDHPYEKHAEMLAWMVARHIMVVTGLRGQRINPTEANGVRDVNELIRLGLDDRDDLSNKIIDTAGSLRMFLYSQAYTEQITKAAMDLNERLNQPDLLSELNSLIRRGIVTEAMTRAIRTGDWGMPNKVKHKGLTRTLQRASIVGAVADIRSLNAPIPRESKDVRPRSVHISTWGYVCPTSTKEGEDCGLAKSLAQGANITTSSDPKLVRDLLVPGGYYVEDEADDARPRFLTRQRYQQYDTPVFLNAAFLGFGDRDVLRAEVVLSRREHTLPRYTSIRLDLDGNLQIHTEAGWLVRPLLVVDADQQLLVEKLGLWGADWGRILQEGAAEEITASEQGDLLIAVHPSDLGKSVMGPDPNVPSTYQEARDPTLTHVPQYTHVELDPALIFSEEANTVPFPTHNPGTRPTYASNMAKHLVGEHHSAAQAIPATTAYTDPATGEKVPAQPAIHGRFESYKRLAYPQRPLVTTDTYRRSEPTLSRKHLEELGKAALGKTDEEVEDIRHRLAEATNTDMFGVVGHMATVAILGGAPEAWDEEDAIMLNRAFVDRGGFMSTTYKAAEYEIENPDSEKLMGKAQLDALKEEERPLYAAIDPATGIARVGSVLRPGMAMVAKYTESAGREPRNTSIFLKSADRLTPQFALKVAPFRKKGRSVKDAETGEMRYETLEEYTLRTSRVRSVLSTSISNEPIMDDVLVGRGGAGKTFIKWKYRITRRPQVGDKFTSRFSQKGVVGKIFPEEDMPFSHVTGMKPDVAVNKHGYITRMTLGQVLESITGKAAAMFGTRVNATAFRDVDHEELKRILKEHGFNYSGAEAYINGITGEMMEAMVFVGPVYYQVQKHMVEEKRHARALGDVHHLYRQPPEGRQRDGGLRLGEMERDAFIAHQARYWLLERYKIVSDETIVHICPTCELPCIANPRHPLYMCEVCGSSEPVPPTSIPRSLLLLYGYNAAMGTKIQMKTGPMRSTLPMLPERSARGELVEEPEDQAERKD